MKKLLSILLCFISLSIQAKNHDANMPIGWATCTSLSDSGTYTVNGGKNGLSIVLKSNGKDMQKTILEVIKSYDIIVFDGENGDFILSKKIDLKNLSNKTIYGINNAKISTQFKLTEKIHHLLDSINVKKELSTPNTGGILSNGNTVKEAKELKIRQFFIDYFKDDKEEYRNSGGFSLINCQNIIIRNLTFIGPGSVDVGGKDLINLSSCKNIWIDHCDFIDGLDGNLDINLKSDFISVTWCKFHYTKRSYNHQLSNLVATNNDSISNGAHNLNITYAYCNWGNGCKQRMPMGRFGTIHILNCYYNCAKCGLAVNARFCSKFLVENCYFDKGVEYIFAEQDATSYNLKDNYYAEKYEPINKGNVTVPYSYEKIDVKNIPSILTSENGVGATLKHPEKITFPKNSKK